MGFFVDIFLPSGPVPVPGPVPGPVPVPVPGPVPGPGPGPGRLTIFSYKGSLVIHFSSAQSIIAMAVNSWNRILGQGSRTVLLVGPSLAISPSPFVVPHTRMIEAEDNSHILPDCVKYPTATH